MLTRLTISNFKSWQSADLEFGRITAIFGANSSGKTSLLQFPLLLKQTKDATDRHTVLNFGAPDQLVDLGTFQDVVFRHAQDQIISWDLRWRQDDPVKLPDPEGKKTDFIAEGHDLSIQASASIRKTELACRSLSYALEDARFSLTPKLKEGKGFQLEVSGLSGFRATRTTGRAWDLPGPIKCYAFPDQARTYFQNTGFLSLLEREYERQMDQIFYLGPLREYPKRDYYWSKTRPSDVGWRGERTIEAILAATTSGEKQNLKPRSPRRNFQEIIAHWLRDMKLISDFSMAEIGTASNRWQAKVRVSPESPEVLLTDVGFGVSQVLPVLTLMHYVPQGSTIILEQPEIHLHPFAQAGLADVILSVSKHRGIQFVIESHSEHFLQRIQRRISEEYIANTDVKLYFIGTEDGKSRQTNLNIDLFGTILNWPKNFFGDLFGDVAAAEKARVQRQIKAIKSA
jgi:predicted ATPase